MPADEGQTILRRMLHPPPNAVGGEAMSGARAWRLSLPRASEEVVGMVASVAGFELTLSDLEAVLDDWGEFALVLGMEGPGASRGFAMVDLQARAALIEVQTMGRVTKADPPDRAATAADAALTGHVIDAWIGAYCATADDGKLKGWRTAQHLTNARAAKMAADDGEYERLDLVLSFDDGARTGRVRLVVPFGAPKADSPKAEAGETTDRGVLLEVEAELEAILYRSTVPLDWLTGLDTGAILEIPPEAVARVQLEDADGRHVATGQLGKSQGQKAVRLSDPDEAAASPAPPAFDPTGPDAPDLPGGLGAGGFDAGGLGGGDLPDLGGEAPAMGELPDLGGAVEEEPAMADLPDLSDLPGMDEPMDEAPAMEMPIADFDAEGLPPLNISD